MALTLAGVDGCRGGWCAAMTGTDGAPSLRVAPDFDALLRDLPPDALLAVDMPIGLPDRIVGAGRPAEIAARPLLKGRASSVFSIPARAAVEAGVGPFADAAAREAAYRESCRLARGLSDPPRAVSRQGFALFRRIGEIDRRLRADAALRDRVFEGHPELAFARMGEGVPSRHGKAAPGGAGLAERRVLLLAGGLPPALLEAKRPSGVAEDDRIDACAMLLLARRIAAGEARPHPDPPARDRYGLPVAIWN